MTVNNLTKLSFSSNEAFPMSIDGDSGELNIDFNNIKIGGINSASADNYPFIKSFYHISGLKTGCYRADSTTKYLPHDAKGIEQFTVFLIANSVNSVQDGSTNYNTISSFILIGHASSDSNYKTGVKVWLGSNVKLTYMSNGGNQYTKWTPMDSRGGCGVDIYNTNSSNEILDFFDNIPTGYYWSTIYRNGPKSNAHLIVEKISHGDSMPETFRGHRNYVHIATYRVTETFKGGVLALPTETPIIWNGYLYYEPVTEKRHIKWFKA